LLVSFDEPRQNWVPVAVVQISLQMLNSDGHGFKSDCVALMDGLVSHLHQKLRKALLLSHVSHGQFATSFRFFIGGRFCGELDELN
jgi:hypothetical protein